MKLLLLLLIAVVVQADEPQASAPSKSKEEMRRELNSFVQEKSEAAASIAPLIEKVKAILSTDKKQEIPSTHSKSKPSTQNK